MVRTAARALLCSMLLLGACGDDDSDARGEGIRVSGVVRNADTGDGVKGVELELLTDLLDEARGKSGSGGDYDLVVTTNAANARITATKSGYQARTVSVYLDSDDVEVDIDLTPK